MLTFGNGAYLDMLLSWVFHAERAGIDYYIIGALNDELLPELLARQMPAFSMDRKVTVKGEDLGWMSQDFRKMVSGIAQLLDLAFAGGRPVCWVATLACLKRLHSCGPGISDDLGGSQNHVRQTLTVY